MARANPPATAVALWILAAGAGPAPAAPEEAPPSGAIRGRVRYDGPAPAAARLEVDVNQEVCGKRPIWSEELVLGPDAGLANVALVLQGAQPIAGPVKGGRLDQRGCVFAPHVQTLTVGAELKIGNDDPVIHNVHARLGERTLFNLGMPLRGIQLTRTLEVPGVVTLSCDSGHGWMKAYLVVVPHDAHATSDADGSFVIGGIAPGAHRLRAWHEKLGVVEQAVSVTAGRTATVTIVFGERAPPRVEAPPIAAPAPPPAPTGADPRDLRLARREADVAAGRGSYLRYCAPCHGDRGDGRGEAARYLATRPRDFTRGEYKFKSTPSGAPAREEDLLRTIAVGVPGSDMPSWSRILAPSEQRLLARYLMTFSERFLDGEAALPIAIPPETEDDQASRRRGREVWARLRCAQCHGDEGGAEAVSRKMHDDWGHPIRPADLRRGVYRSGPLPSDIYRTLITGLAGTPMPAVDGLISPSETWDLVHYVRSLARPGIFDLLR
jgi:cytochrome c oxidase cbb3-type subunit 2